MATAAFKSNSKRSSNDKASSPKSNPNNKPENPKQKQRLRRSLSVSAGSAQFVRNSEANGNRRRGTHPSRARYPQSEAEQESRTGITYGGNKVEFLFRMPSISTLGMLHILGVKSFDRRSAHPSRLPSVSSSVSLWINLLLYKMRSLYVFDGDDDNRFGTAWDTLSTAS
ncbi:hypothetical protein Tco_1406783 [Tanacetum coccineum]